MLLPVLYIGERASLSEQNRTWYEELQLTVLADESSKVNVDQISPEERLGRFRQRWQILPINKRIMLVDLVMNRLRLSTGYRALASLVDSGYFRLILTGNLDSLIENSLIKRSGGVRQRQFSLLANGSYPSTDYIKDTLMRSTRPSIIFKLLGDFASHDDTTIATRDIKKYMEPLQSILPSYLSSLLIIVGAGKLDEEIFSYFQQGTQSTGDRVYYACSKLPEIFYTIFPQRPLEPLTDETTDFDEFFTSLAQELGVAVQPVTGPLSGPVMVEPPQAEPLPKEEKQRASDERVPDTTPPAAANPASVDFDELMQQKVAEEGPVELEYFTTFSINIDLNQRLSFNVDGELQYSSPENKEWDVDIEAMRLRMQDLGDDIVMYYRSRSESTYNKWRRRAKDMGEQLYTGMMSSYRDLEKKFDWASTQPLLTFSFNGPLKYLSIPFELMYYSGHPLAVQYPLCRTVSGVPFVRNRVNFDTFIRSLRKNKSQLRVLLIASDIDGMLSVNEEVEQIGHILRERARSIKLDIFIKPLKGDEATLANVEKLLKEGNYHIVHYAGHGMYDEQVSENSALFFPSGKRQSGNTEALVARKLRLLMNASKTQLFYMSSCVGAQIGNNAQLYNGDYLGMMDALVMAGVPYVLGYRWYVSDKSSIQFATTFYKELFQSQFIPEYATHAARKAIYGENGNDETWASALLIAQHVYH